ncbi:hypothetical protein EBT16_00945 [bacterium]|nr:hypothetical protein [bacterium]
MNNEQTEPPIELLQGKTELIDTLRQLASPSVCKLPDGWDVELLSDGELCFHKNKYVQGSIDTDYFNINEIMDLLGRLMRAIEAEGVYKFYRYCEGKIGESPRMEWGCCAASRDYVFGEFLTGSVEQEALALAKCILAACAVEAVPDHQNGELK